LVFEYYSKICQEYPSFVKNLTRITGTLHEDLYAFVIISHSVLLRMKNISHKCCGKIKHTGCSTIFFSASRAVYEIIWINTVETGRLQMTDSLIGRMRIACWIPTATDTLSE
jgi:hypothetical protein